MSKFTNFGSQSNYNKFNNSYFRNNVDISGILILRKNSKFYNNDLTSYDISGTLNINNYKSIYFNNLVYVYIKSINVYDRLTQVILNTASIMYLNSNIVKLLHQ